MPRTARVLLDGRLAGILEETEAGTRFRYLPEWLALPGAAPIALTMPLRAEPYEHRGLHPFFENLLPEGWLLELSTAHLHIPKDDAFGLLLALGRDTAGAVEIVPGEGGA